MNVDVKSLLLKHIDLSGLVGEILSSIVKPKLDKLAADSANSFDNVALELVFPVVEKAILEAVSKADPV